MNRFFSTLAVMTMALLAIALCLRQTFEMREALGDDVVLGLFVLQAFLAAALLGVIGFLVRKNGLWRRPVSRGRFEVFQPLRRLLSAVWS